MSAASDQFEYGTRRLGNDQWSVRIAKCSVCGKTEDMRDNTGRGMPPPAVAQKFRQRGWEIGARRSKDRCPEHSRVPGAMDMANKARRQRKAAYVAIGRREGTIPPAKVVVIDAGKVAKAAGVLAMADPVGGIMDAVEAAAKLEVLGHVTRREPPKQPELELQPVVPRRRVMVVDQPMFDPPPGTDVRVKRNHGGHRTRQTGWKPTIQGGSIIVVRESAVAALGPDVIEGVDFDTFTEADGTMGWKPLRKEPQTIATIPSLPPSQETPMPDTPTQAAPGAVDHDWTAPEYNAKRRKVLDYLDDKYDGVRRYRGDGSDRKAAEELDVPRGLVAHVRAQFFGPDVNEAAEQTVRDLKAMEADANKLMARHMDLAADAEALRNRCSAALAKLGA